MNINLKRFVDVNIISHVSSAVVGTRPVTALFTSEGSSLDPVKLTSYTEAKDKYAVSSDILSYAKVYFDNGGVELWVYENYSFTSSEGKRQLTLDVIKGLDNSIICIAYVIGNEDTMSYASLKSIAVSLSTDSTVYGINEKMLMARTTSKTDTDAVKNFVAKYSSCVGAEMTIAAYLSKIDVYGIDTVYDYAFTQENLDQYDESGKIKSNGAESLSDVDFGTIQANNINVDVFLANAVRNCGGNCKNGADVVNTYVKIILHQTITDRLMSLLSQKLKNETGVSKIYTVLSQELSRYLTCGYLTTDKIWTDNDLVVRYNNQSYSIIDQGTALTSGYVVRVLPMTSLTEEDKLLHKAPPVYIVIADQYGIRKITINGEVI